MTTSKTTSKTTLDTLEPIHRLKQKIKRIKARNGHYDYARLILNQEIGQCLIQIKAHIKQQRNNGFLYNFSQYCDEQLNLSTPTVRNYINYAEFINEFTDHPFFDGFDLRALLPVIGRKKLNKVHTYSHANRLAILIEAKDAKAILNSIV